MLEREAATGARATWLAGLGAQFAGRAASAARYLAIAVGFSLQFSTAADSVLLALLLVCWLASGHWRTKYETIRGNPVATAALLLFAVVIAGLAWGKGSTSDGVGYAKKYIDLLLVPILVTIFARPEDRQRGLLALTAGIVLTLALSYALALGWKPDWKFITAEPGNPTVFRRHITQNLLVAFGALLFLYHAANARDNVARWAWFALSALAAVNVLFLVQGRTGYLVLAGLVLLVLIHRLRWRGVAAGTALIVLGFASAYTLSNSFQTRVELAVSEAVAWRSDQPANSPIAFRLEFYRNTARIIREHPLLGVGTGGFEVAYAEQTRGTAMTSTRNPHSLYLLVTAQFGVIGLAALLFLLFRQWRCAALLAVPGHTQLARGVVLTFAVGGIFNSLIIDHAEGLFFAWLSGLLFAGLDRAQPGQGAS